MGKSPCCSSKIRRFGKRRRQCATCGRTWRIRTKKIGRPKLRHYQRLIRQVLLQQRSLTELARSRNLSRQALSYRFLGALARHLKHSRPVYPAGNGDLILLLDGLWFRFNRRIWVVYLMALKRPADDAVTFIDPFMQLGTESREGWIRALRTIPADIQKQIRAVVCDNYAGSMTVAALNSWILQYCHFHLIASLHSKLGLRHPRSVSAKEIRKEGYALVKTSLTTADDSCLQVAIARLRALTIDPNTPWKFGNIMREFVRRVHNYRAYRQYPELRLPKTTSSVESMCRVIRDMMRRTRSLSTPQALILWITVYIRLRPKIACRPAGFSTN